MRRGEIWWADRPPPDHRRPVVLLSRDRAIAIRRFVTVAQVTTVVRSLRTEVALGVQDGLPRESVINADVLATIPKSALTGRICALSREESAALDAALRFALALE